jgi:hypothetical protein
MSGNKNIIIVKQNINNIQNNQQPQFQAMVPGVG